MREINYQHLIVRQPAERVTAFNAYSYFAGLIFNLITNRMIES